jgi:signal peptide peptidase SppA
VLNLSGVIGKTSQFNTGMTFESLSGNIERAFEFEKAKAVVLVVNSPGGSPAQSELIAAKIIALSAEKKIPVITFVEDVAASGGYWLALAADEVFVLSSSIIGSIGVISAGFGFVDAIHKLGIQRRVYAQGDNKSILDPFKPERKEDIEILSGVQLEVHEHFKSYVKARRGTKLKGEDSYLFTGEFWSGKRATELGLVDGIGNMEEILKDRFGRKVRFLKIQSEKSWFKKMLGMNGPASLVNSLAMAAEEKIAFMRFGR